MHQEIKLVVQIVIRKGESEATLQMSLQLSLVVGRHIIPVMIIPTALEITNIISILEVKKKIGLIAVKTRKYRLFMEKMVKLTKIVTEQLSMLGQKLLMYWISDIFASNINFELKNEKEPVSSSYFIKVG